MKTYRTSPQARTSFLFLTGLVIAAFVAMSLPTFAFAATYAYVNTAGEVRIVVADTPMVAISTAPGIGIHSGVLLLNSPADNDVVGDNVLGM